MSNHHDGGGSIAWFLAGCALGAAGALLLAPQTGRETRAQLRERAERSRERLEEARREAYERGRRAYEEGRRRADEAAESGRKYVERGRELYERGRSVAEETATRFRREAAEEIAPEEPEAPAEG